MADKSQIPEDERGGAAFITMLVVIAYLFVVCIILPLAIPGYSQQSYALPLMASGLALPFLHFFIFGGMALATKNKDKK